MAERKAGDKADYSAVSSRRMISDLGFICVHVGGTLH